MKQTIKVKVVVDGCAPTISEDGDWIDLRSAIPVELNGPTAEMLKKHNVHVAESADLGIK